MSDELPDEAPAGPARQARRPLAAPDQPGARRVAAAARARRSARLTASEAARPRRPRAGPPPLRLRGRRPRADAATGSPPAGSAGGWTPQHRAPFKLDALAAGTWRAGPRPGPARGGDDRGGPALVRGVLPLDDVESGAIDLAGRFAEFVDRVRDGARRAVGAQPIGDWAAAIAAAADALTATASATPGSARELAAAARRRRSREATHEASVSAVPLELGRCPGAARRPAARPPDAGELPHRAPDDLHARADALGPAPRRLPPRPRRRRVPAQGARATATT